MAFTASLHLVKNVFNGQPFFIDILAPPSLSSQPWVKFFLMENSTELIFPMV